MEVTPGSGRRQREMRKYRRTELLILLLILAVIAGFFLIIYLGKNHTRWTPNESSAAQETTRDDEAVWAEKHVQELIEEAEQLAVGYDFDGAIRHIEQDELYRNTLVLLEKVEELQERQKSMVAWPDVKNITHICVRPLVADTNIAYNAGAGAETYNANYITVAEFEAILQELYDRDYVLVSLHDIATTENYRREQAAMEETTEAATTDAEETAEETTVAETTMDASMAEEMRTLKKRKILLPEGKTPIVLSEENICYTPEMGSNGFTAKLIVKKDGTLLSELADGTTGAFDVVPVLEAFIEKHPDFSYCGARAVLGVSGSDGVFGYKTSYLYKDLPDFEAQKEQAQEVAQALLAKGYEFGMNGYHYTNMSQVAMDDATLENEMKHWLEEVAPIVGTTDILVYPNGADIADWHYYGGPRYEYLASLGFVYYLNMNDNERAWNQLLNFYLRQGRRMITGKLLAKEVNGAQKFTDLFDAADVFDKNHLPFQ